MPRSSSARIVSCLSHFQQKTTGANIARALDDFGVDEDLLMFETHHRARRTQTASFPPPDTVMERSGRLGGGPAEERSNPVGVFGVPRAGVALSLYRRPSGRRPLGAQTRRPPYCRERATSMVKVEMLVRDRPLRTMASFSRAGASRGT